MATILKIHPAIGIARVGNSNTEFYLAPEVEGGLPLDCDPDGNPVVVDGKEQTVSRFKDADGRIKRQAARFRVFVYDDASPKGRELQAGEQITVIKPKSGQKIVGEVIDVTWNVYLANKKASWYQFQQTDGEYGYAPNHPLRNAAISDPQQRQQLIIDPGPRSVRFGDENQRHAQFERGPLGAFPPPLQPHSITTLGQLHATRQAQHDRLLVLGGYGNSGSSQREPMITAYANNDGWFDDVSDGPVNASVNLKVISIDGHTQGAGGTLSVPVNDPAWVIVGYPRYAPQITDMVTMNDVVFDLSVRQFAFEPLIYGVAPYDTASNSPQTEAQWALWHGAANWNRNYRPYFWRDIWPIISRPFNYKWVMDFDQVVGANPHDTAVGGQGNFDPTEIAIPPNASDDPQKTAQRTARRMFVYSILRHPNEVNQFTKAVDPRFPDTEQILMPYLCGDNPLSNTAASKFLCLTATQLFILRQWAEGKFINEQLEKITPPDLHGPGVQLDQGALANLLGGAFCPGAEAGWIIRNPAIFRAPYRIKYSASAPVPGSLSQPAIVGAEVSASLAVGQEPGDLTKYSAQPWQADFNECSTQDVNITYQDWNVLYQDSTGEPVPSRTQPTYWWPSHRPMTVFAAPDGNSKQWSPSPGTNAGDLWMVTLWSALGFIKASPGDPNDPDNPYIPPNYYEYESQV